MRHGGIGTSVPLEDASLTVTEIEKASKFQTLYACRTAEGFFFERLNWAPSHPSAHMQTEEGKSRPADLLGIPPVPESLAVYRKGEKEVIDGLINFLLPFTTKLLLQNRGLLFSRKQHYATGRARKCSSDTKQRKQKLSVFI